MNVVSAGIFSAPIAENKKNANTRKKTTRPMPLDGLTPGVTFST